MVKSSLPKGSKTFSLGFEDQSELQMLYLFRRQDQMHLQAIETEIYMWKMRIINRFAINPNEMDIDLSDVFDAKKPTVYFTPKSKPEVPPAEPENGEKKE